MSHKKSSFGHKSVILSLPIPNFESKNFFYKTCLLWFSIWGCDTKNEILLSLCKILNYASNHKDVNNIYNKYLLYDHCNLLLSICEVLSVVCYLWLDIRIFSSETCYQLQKIVSFARCCLSQFLIFLGGTPKMTTHDCPFAL